MNYGEELSYWYLRLNGFFPLSNFVMHRGQDSPHTSDCDLLAVRLPHVFEEIGGQHGDWDECLQGIIPFQKTCGLICEVKTGRYDVRRLFPEDRVRYCIGRLGLVPIVDIDQWTAALDNNPVAENESLCIAKLLIAYEGYAADNSLFIPLRSVDRFIHDRVRLYSEEKYRDRMFFQSDLFQHTIQRVHDE